MCKKRINRFLSREYLKKKKSALNLQPIKEARVLFTISILAMVFFFFYVRFCFHWPF